MRNYGKLVANLVQNHLPTMRNYGKLVNLQNHLPTMRNYGKLVVNFGTKSSTYYEKLW